MDLFHKLFFHSLSRLIHEKHRFNLAIRKIFSICLRRRRTDPTKKDELAKYSSHPGKWHSVIARILLNIARACMDSMTQLST